MSHPLFIIHTQAGHGAERLQQVLRSHPQCRAYGQLLHVDARKLVKQSPDPKERKLAKYLNRPPEPFWHRFYHTKDHKDQTAGFVLHSADLFPERRGPVGLRRSDEYLPKYPWRVVELFRMNLLEAYATTLEATNPWPVLFDPQQWREYVKATRKDRQDTRAVLDRSPCLRLWGERLDRYPEEYLADLYSFLGLPKPIPTEISLPDNRPLPERFANVDDVMVALKGTEWQGCLYRKPTEW